MIKKGTFGNAQVKQNRKWEIGNHMVESGVLGHRDGT